MAIALMIRRSERYWSTRKIDFKGMYSDPGPILKAIEKWNLSINYEDFRFQLREIATKSIIKARPRFDYLIPWSDRQAVSALIDGDWLVPIDEDDYINPEMFGVINSVLQSVEAQNYDCLTFGVYRSSATNEHVTKHFVESCGYALKAPVDWHAVTNHMLINQECDTTFHIPRILTIRNETPASLGFLLSFNGSLKSVIDTAINRGIPTDLPEWAYDYMLLYQKLLGAV